MFWKTRTAILIYLLLAALILSACAAAPAPTTVETSTPEASEATELPATQAPQPEETEPPQPEATELPTSTPTEAAFPPAMRIAYVGADGNVWVLDTGEAEPRQITSDAVTPPMDGTAPDSQMINYYFPAISSDGALVAYRRDEGTPAESGFDFAFGLWVTDLSTGESREVYNQTPAGFAWKPGTHLLVYGQGVSEAYFAIRGEVDESLATGITAVNLDTGESRELVAPEGGYALSTPIWSPDGRFLSFDEVAYYEGRGNFAYYDFEAQEYVALGQPLGLYDWSPDGEQIVYDNLTYTATGEERIYLRDRQGGDERLLSPDYEQGYAFYPVFSPQGDRVAYFANLGAIDDSIYHLYVQNLAGGEPTDLGEYESVQSPAWSPDGSALIFSAGPFDGQQVLAVKVAGGSAAVLAEGSEPDVSGR